MSHISIGEWILYTFSIITTIFVYGCTNYIKNSKEIINSTTSFILTFGITFGIPYVFYAIGCTISIVLQFLGIIVI